MQTTVVLPTASIAELFFHICRSGQVTLLDRCQLKTAVLKDSLSDEEVAAIDRLIHAVRRGWLIIVE